jgi:uncharacterized cupin superfamily protein
MDEAELGGESGRVPRGPGWFVVNLRDARWREVERFGRYCPFEGETRFPHLGVNVHVLAPGQPACLYHRENQQEAFLVLSGECTLVVEEQERALGPWDFFHCPPGTSHVFVGRGEGPCAILMIGARLDEEELVYPVSPVAARHRASAARETTSPREAYAGTPPPRDIPSPWPPVAGERA